MWLAGIFLLGQLLALVGAIRQDPLSRMSTSAVLSKCVLSEAGTESTLELAAAGRLGPNYPQLPRVGVDSGIVPATLLKAVAWVENNWNQYDSNELPSIAFDWGYGVMQITYGMPGASGPNGTINIPTSAGIAGDATFNITYGARVLTQYFKQYPPINHRDPTALENWYYALMAYNGFSANNPNGSWSRVGTPANNAGGFPYQERVYWWVQHPPVVNGRPLWTPMHITLPPSGKITDPPTALTLKNVHTQIPHLFGATYDVPGALATMRAASKVTATVTAYNAGALPWKTGSSDPIKLMYHWVKWAGHKASGYNKHLGGIDVLDDPHPLKLPQVVPVDGSIRVPVKIRAPANTTGNLLLEWDMVDHDSGWFSKNGVSPGKQKVQVVASDQSVPRYVDPPAPVYLGGNHAWYVGVSSTGASSVLTPRESYSETVLMYNPGATTWGPKFHLQLKGKTASAALPMSKVAACRMVPITLQATAPSKPGKYTDAWQMESSRHRLFGATIPIHYTVVKGNTVGAKIPHLTTAAL